MILPRLTYTAKIMISSKSLKIFFDHVKHEALLHLWIDIRMVCGIQTVSFAG